MSKMHSDFQNNNFNMVNKLCPFCCQQHKMAEYSGVWYCTKLPMTQGGLSEKNLNLLSGNIKILHERMDDEWEKKNKAVANYEALSEDYKNLGDKYILLKARLSKEKGARIAADRKAENLVDTRERDEEFMSGFARTMRRIANNVAFLTVK